MSNISLSEIAALLLVLSNVSVKELLHSAMVGLSEDKATQAQDKAIICSQAINTFLN